MFQMSYKYSFYFSLGELSWVTDLDKIWNFRLSGPFYEDGQAEHGNFEEGYQLYV